MPLITAEDEVLDLSRRSGSIQPTPATRRRSVGGGTRRSTSRASLLRGWLRGRDGRVRGTAAGRHDLSALTLAQIRSSGAGPLPVDGVVHVVENPSILALALDRFGPACPPLVCTAGWPTGAGVLLLRRLAAAGQEIRYHGDLDGDGVRIVAYVMAKVGARPWRMSAVDYREVVPSAGPPIGGLSDAPWDAELAHVMAEHRIAVVEERTSDLLLADLAAFSFGS